MANENDPKAPASPPLPVEGPTKQFSLKMSGWLSSLAGDFDSPAPAPEEAPLDDLLGAAPAPPPAPAAPAAPTEEELSLEAALFPSEPPPKP